MAIQISGTTVIDNSRNITNVIGVGDTSTTVYYGDGSNLTGISVDPTLLIQTRSGIAATVATFVGILTVFGRTENINVPI